MSFTSRLTNLAAAGVGGEAFWRLEIYASSGNFELQESAANDIAVLSDGSMFLTANPANQNTDQHVIKVSADGEILNSKKYNTAFTSTSGGVRKIQGLTYDSVNDKGILAGETIDQNSSNLVALVAGVSSNGNIQAIYRKDDYNDSYRQFADQQNGTYYYWSGGEYYYQIGRDPGATDYLYVFDASNGGAPVNRIGFAGHNGSIKHLAGKDNLLAMADNRRLHLLQLSTNGTVSVVWSKYFTNGQAGTADSQVGGEVVCHINDDNDVIYFGFNRERTTVYRFGLNGTKESAKAQVENGSTKLYLYGSKYVTSSGSTDGGRLWAAGNGLTSGDSRLYYQLNGNGYNWLDIRDPDQSHSVNTRCIGIDPNTNATIIGGYCYDSSLSRTKIVLYRLPDFHNIRTASDGGVIASTGSGNITKHSVLFDFYTTDSTYEPQVSNNTLTLSTSSNTSEFGYKGSPTGTSVTLNEDLTALST